MAKLALVLVGTLVVAALSACGGGGGGTIGPAGGGTGPFVNGPGGGGTGPFPVVSSSPSGPVATAIAPISFRDVTGSWTGTWDSPDGTESGNVDGILVQNGRAIAGSFTFTGSPCLSGGPVKGGVRGNGLEAELDAGQVRVQLALATDDLDADVMSGTCEVIGGAACAGKLVAISLSRVAPVGGSGQAVKR
jgi:hypothetical protein